MVDTLGRVGLRRGVTHRSGAALSRDVLREELMDEGLIAQAPLLGFALQSIPRRRIRRPFLPARLARGDDPDVFDIAKPP